MHIVRGDKRQVLRVGEIDQLSSTAASLGGVALKLDVEPIAEPAGEPLEQSFGGLRLTVAMSRLIGPLGPPVRRIRPAEFTASFSAEACGSSPGSTSR
jgi:hypothetical protein